jgi:predicted transposase YbfD/YdcC
MDKAQNKFASLIEAFGQVKDPRIDRSKRHPLIEILFLTVSAVISGIEGWEEIEDFGHEKIEWLRKYLPYENEIPSHDTISRVLSTINQRAFEQCFMDWATMSLTLPKGTVISIDGKRLRGSATKKQQQLPRDQGGKGAIHLLHAWCHELQMCLAQYEVDGKTNEIKAIPELLEFLDIEGCLITIDSIGCQKAIAQQIVDQKADYLFGLKDNQEKLCRGAFEAFESDKDGKAEAGRDEQESTKNHHGRKETRVCRILPKDSLDQWAGADEWPGFRTIIEIQAERQIIASGRIEQ